MRKFRNPLIGLALLATVAFGPPLARAANKPPSISAFSRPSAGSMQLLFRGSSGPFLVQSRDSLAAGDTWTDVPEAVVSELQGGVYSALIPNPTQSSVDLRFYRIVSEGDPTSGLNGWTIMLRVSAPSNGQYFAVGEAPTVTVTILDTMGQLGISDFSTLNLYMYGPQDPQQTVTAVKLLNASTDRTKHPHHYIDLTTNTNVQTANNVMTYQLQPITDEKPGTYTVSLWSVLASDGLQQIMKFADIQIGTPTVEAPVVVKDQCAACHLGPVSGKVYMHHIDPGFSPTGNWALDFQPVTSCKSCHNNDGYSAYTDATGAATPDPIVRRVHGVHMGSDLKLPFDTNSATGDFKAYTRLEFPADVRDCTKCHTDNRWQTQPSRAACGACHDDIWFGPKPVPADQTAHAGGAQADDSKCSVCHLPASDPSGIFESIAESHQIPPPALGSIAVSLTPPANTNFYVAGEKPVVTVVIQDDSGNPIDHTKVTDGNFSVASLFVYGPRAQAVPVLTSTAKNVNSKLRASVTSSIGGPWAINGKTFEIAINKSAPQNITITGAASQVTAAEVAASLNSVITNLNGGAIATVSGANVNIKTLIQGANARIEIYSGEVTTAMGWKRGPNTVMDPDVTIAAGTYANNDLRTHSDPLDYSDPMVTRANASITYQLDDVAGLAPGTYNAYVYASAKTNKVAGLTAPVGIGHVTFQVGTATPEKKIATNCTDCHAGTIFHLSDHPAPFDTDYCTACHDYLHTTPGDMFKNQGGTSLSGWSGFGAVPIARRVHGVHFAHYLDHPEEIYANATTNTFSGIIFPQDVRNCTKCHAESDAWKQQPSRVACLACHDSDQAKAHGRLMTDMADPTDPYGPGAQESCSVCHGAGAEFSPDKVHSISNPYVAPYPR